MDKIESLILIQQNIHHNIKFADSKAMAVTALNLAVLGGLQVLGVFDASRFELFTLGCASFLLVSVSILVSIQVIRPRGAGSKEIEFGYLCDPNKIVKRDFGTFFERISEASAEDLENDISTLIYDRSYINNEKYFWLKVELWVALAGWGLTLITAFISFFS